MSADGNHDEAFWQHCADDTIKHYKGVLEVSFSVIMPPSLQLERWHTSLIWCIW